MRTSSGRKLHCQYEGHIGTYQKIPAHGIINEASLPRDNYTRQTNNGLSFFEVDYKVLEPNFDQYLHSMQPFLSQTTSNRMKNLFISSDTSFQYRTHFVLWIKLAMNRVESGWIK